MTDHPEYPQESPAMKYVIEQVSKIEDAQACGTGYYKSLSKVLSRLDKTDTTLTQLQQNVTDLKKIIDFEGVSLAINNHTDVMSAVVKSGLSQNTAKIDEQFKVMISKQHEYNTAMFKDINDISKRMDDHIADVNNRVIPPLWKIYAYAFLALCVGFVIGKWVL